MAEAAIAHKPVPRGKAEPNRRAAGLGEFARSMFKAVDTGPGWTGLQGTITFTPHDTSPGS